MPDVLQPQVESLRRTPPSGVFAYSLPIRRSAHASRGKDRSQKGSLDEPIAELVGFINAQRDYVTTSSCSGRIALFQDLDGGICMKVCCPWCTHPRGGGRGGGLLC
jgi:hypothetical protein